MSRIAQNVGLLACCAAASAWGSEKSLIDYFLSMEPQGPLVSEGIWGEPAVLPRDVRNGLEDAKLEQWCYWDGAIVRGEDGRYHLYASRWSQEHSHSRGRKSRSQAVHAVSTHPLGPYEDRGLIWPDWQAGTGHNISALRMHDGRYAVVTSEITPATVFVSDAPDGPFKLLGEIRVDANGFDPALARQETAPHHMSNVRILLRPDGRYMIVPRSCCIMISEEGILGPYQIVADCIYRGMDDVPQTRMEDPVVWHSGGLYHVVVNYWRNDTSYHLTSKDGINDWQYRGIAYRHGAGVFRYTDGTTNRWAVVQRPNVLLQDGHPTHFSFAVMDCTKGEDGPHDRNGSKIVVVPFDGEAFDRELQEASTGGTEDEGR